MITLNCKYWYNQALVNAWPNTFACKVTPVPVPPGPTPQPQPAPTPTPLACGCSAAKVPYQGAGEQIAQYGPSKDFRCIINDQSWITNKVLASTSVTFTGLSMAVKCFDLDTGIRAHFMGSKQPSSGSPLVATNPQTVSNSGTLRLIYESRKPA